MPSSLHEARAAIINDILFAASQTEVIRIIETALKALSKKNIEESEVEHFIQDTITELNLFSPINKDALQWSNINMGRIYLNRIKNKISHTIN